jgi:hypothetical protein
MKILFLTLIFATTTPCWSRFIQEPWDYEKLAKSADVIIVAAPLKVEETKELEAVPSMFLGGLDAPQPVMARVSLTTFSVQTVLKGDVGINHFSLRHLRVPEEGYSARQSMIAFQVNGPGFVKFDPKSDGCFLMFLKRLPSGQFVSVTGQTDPEFGIKRLDGYPGPTINQEAEAGTGQSATRSQSKSEGNDKPQPEAEERSR